MSSYEHLFWGYSVIWIVLVLGFFALVREQRKLVRALEELKK